MTKYVRFLTIMLFSFVSVLSLAPTPAHAQYQNNYQPVYRVETYGAVKNQSGVDNSGAFNRAIAAASSAGGGIVEVDSGTYWAQGSIVLKQNVWLRGKSASTSIIKLANDKIASLDNFTKSGAQGNKQYAFIRTDHANAATTTLRNCSVSSCRINTKFRINPPRSPSVRSGCCPPASIPGRAHRCRPR